MLKMANPELEEIRTSLCSILDLLGWNEEYLLSEETKAQCPLDEKHLVPESVLKDHLERCCWLKQGYSSEERASALPSASFSYGDASTTINIDKDVLHKITSAISSSASTSGYGGYGSHIAKAVRDVPKTVDRFTVEFSPQERLAVYDYVVNKGKEMRKNMETSVEDLLIDFEKKDNKDAKPKSRLELLAEQRDYKRRRPTYRAKNVHITKKSYTEVMKEVIENQMSFLNDMQNVECTCSNSDKESNSNVDEPEKDSDDDDKNPDDLDYVNHKSERPSKESHERRHHKRKHSRSKSKDKHRHSDSHRHKRSHHEHDRKRRKH